jgi:hypothetical protein
MTTASNKAKARGLQKWLREGLLKRFDLQEEDITSTPMGVQGEDVQLSPAARDQIPYQFECKRPARSAIYGAYEQAEGHGNHEPIVILQANRKKALAIIDADVLLDLLKNGFINNI